MIRTLLGGSIFVASLSTAPMQCRREPQPELRREDTAGDALFELAMDFRRHGNEQAARETLRFLVEHYPSNRRAELARVELARHAGSLPEAQPAPSR